MAKSDKALENLKKLYGEQTALNKKILAAEKMYAAELKAEAKAVTKQTKAVKPARKATKVPARKTGVAKAPALAKRKNARSPKA
jgi:hypothetical protein